VLLQMAANLWLLHREFRKKLRFEAEPAVPAPVSAPA
jgi:hypothetical protein